jgi:hypothetical protein
MNDLPESCVAIDTLFRKRGYGHREIEQEDVYSKWVIYYKDFRRSDKNMMFRIELKFDLSIHDDPGGSYDDNHELYFEEAHLAVYDRRMEEDPEMLQFDDGPYYLEETENLKRFGAHSIRMSSLADLDTLERLLA